MERRSLVITMAILLGLNSAVLVGYLSIHIPLARQIFGFLTLTFLPGYLLLDIFRTKLESLSERISLSVALSISTVMFIGIFVNFIYPFLGIEKPITLEPILITFNVVILLLLSVQQRRTLPLHMTITLNGFKITKCDLFFSLLPLLSLLSAYRFSFYGDNRGLLALYFIISLTPMIFAKIKDFNRTFAIWSIAISLIWSTVFGMSWNYIWGYDINGEYHYANLVLSRGIWHISTFYQYNTVASVNLLAPIYSLILDIDIIPIFKVIYPLIFSLLPVILLKAYEKLLEKKVWAELSVLFFMFLFTFFTEMMALARQMIAEVYLALLVYATIKRINPLLLIIFLASLAVSHYGTAYLTMFALLALLPVTVVKLKRKITTTSIAFLWITTLLWYQYAGGGYEFHTLTDIGYQTILMLQDIFNPQYSQGLAIIISKTTLMREVAKWINLLAQGIITVGILTIVWRLSKGKSIKYLEFYVLSLVFFAYAVAGVIVPLFANRLNATRLYQITLFFLSPYFVVGGTAIRKMSHRILNRFSGSYNLKSNHTTKVIAIFLLVYFLFNSGWMLVMANDPKSPMWMKKVDGPYWDSVEIHGGKWIAEHRYDDLKVYSDQYHALIFLGLIGQPISSVSFRGKKSIINFPTRDAYVYLGSKVIEKKKIMLIHWRGAISEAHYLSLFNSSISKPLMSSQKIYASNTVWIYKV